MLARRAVRLAIPPQRRNGPMHQPEDPKEPSISDARDKHIRDTDPVRKDVLFLREAN